jgi:hypothetical protein
MLIKYSFEKTIRPVSQKEQQDTTFKFQITAIDFNPCSREGSDLCDTDQRGYGFYFNPRSREGSDSNFRQKNLKLFI